MAVIGRHAAVVVRVTIPDRSSSAFIVELVALAAEPAADVALGRATTSEAAVDILRRWLNELSSA